IDRIPRTASGKITRHLLLERPARLRATGGGRHESLLRPDWIPLPSVPVRGEGDGASAPAAWGAAGDGTLGGAGAATGGTGPGGEGSGGEGPGGRGAEPVRFADLDAVHEAASSGAPLPEVVVTFADPGGEQVRDLAARLEAWAADE